MVTILRNALHIPHIRIFESIISRGVCIFNPDNKRIQATLKKTNHVIKQLHRVLEENGFMTERKLGHCVVLMSKPGCKQQSWHTDYDPDSVKKLMFKPLGVIVALQKNTYFEEYPNIRHVLNRGDVLIFEGDVIHAGAAYKSRNIRIHAYVDSQFHKRLKNKTYLVTKER